ncbi:hypothetical protein [Sphingobacterium tabacisoli]|uniref:Adhesin domain-containing protein n=1 Tax=Sphingobacterium tabacisoli TaxID=2044855 RepID=A0ABW5LBL8_9SPHI|nr:hypothetical protein [Sphingobacterium tabacisoli]
MKKSNIILLLSIVFAVLYFLCPSVFGVISIDQKGNPTDIMSKFWFNLYPRNISLDSDQTISHIKIIGSKDATLSLEINKGAKQHMKSDDQQNFEYKLYKDTLEIKLKNGESYLHLEQPMPIQSISCTNKAGLNLIPVQSTDSLAQLTVTLADNCVLRTGEYTRNYGNGTISRTYGPTKIRNLTLNLSNQSKAYLNGIQTEECTANLTDAFLNCQQSIHIDSLKIHLSGKSAIKNIYLPTDSRWNAEVRPSNDPNIGHLMVSGDQTYFNKKLIRPDTPITIK